MAKEITTQINHLIDLGMTAQQIIDESGIHPFDLRIDLLIHKAWAAKNNITHSEESYAQNVRVLAVFDKWYATKVEELEAAVVNEEAPIETPAQEETAEEAPAVELVPSEAPIHEGTLRHPRFLSLSGNVTADGENLPGTRIAWKSDEENFQMKPLKDGTWEITERVITDHATQRHGQVVATEVLLPGQVDKALNEWLDR